MRPLASVPFYYNEFMPAKTIKPFGDGYMVRSQEDLLEMIDEDFLRRCGICLNKGE